jgi:hypothetical protein
MVAYGRRTANGSARDVDQVDAGDVRHGGARRFQRRTARTRTFH